MRVGKACIFYGCEDLIVMWEVEFVRVAKRRLPDLEEGGCLRLLYWVRYVSLGERC